MNKITIALFFIASIVFCSCENSDEKVYKSVISNYDIILSEFNSAQTTDVLNATTEKLSSFENGSLKHDYDSLCSINKVPQDVQDLVKQKENDVCEAKSEAISRIR